MRFSITVDGVAKDIPSTSDIGPFRNFREAHVALLDGGQGPNVRTIVWGKGKKPLGQLSTYKGGRSSRRLLRPEEDSSVFPDGEQVGIAGVPCIPDPCHHVALMRPAELVVRYVEGPPPSSADGEYGGVFICDDELEEVFASSEPPAHDDWMPGLLERTEKSYVRVALDKIAGALKGLYGESAEGASAPTASPLGQVSSALGKALMIGGGSGPVAPLSQPRTGKKAARKVARTTLVGGARFSRLLVHEGRPHLMFTQQCEITGAEQLSIRARVAVSLTGGGSAPLEEFGLQTVLPRWRYAGESGWSPASDCWTAMHSGVMEILVPAQPGLGLELRLRADDDRSEVAPR